MHPERNHLPFLLARQRPCMVQYAYSSRWMWRPEFIPRCSEAWSVVDRYLSDSHVDTTTTTRELSDGLDVILSVGSGMDADSVNALMCEWLGRVPSKHWPSWLLATSSLSSSQSRHHVVVCPPGSLWAPAQFLTHDLLSALPRSADRASLSASVRLSAYNRTSNNITDCHRWLQLYMHLTSDSKSGSCSCFVDVSEFGSPLPWFVLKVLMEHGHLDRLHDVRVRYGREFRSRGWERDPIARSLATCLCVCFASSAMMRELGVSVPDARAWVQGCHGVDSFLTRLSRARDSSTRKDGTLSPWSDWNDSLCSYYDVMGAGWPLGHDDDRVSVSHKVDFLETVFLNPCDVPWLTIRSPRVFRRALARCDFTPAVLRDGAHVVLARFARHAEWASEFGTVRADLERFLNLSANVLCFPSSWQCRRDTKPDDDWAEFVGRFRLVNPLSYLATWYRGIALSALLRTPAGRVPHDGVVAEVLASFPPDSSGEMEAVRTTFVDADPFHPVTKTVLALDLQFRCIERVFWGMRDRGQWTTHSPDEFATWFRDVLDRCPDIQHREHCRYVFWREFLCQDADAWTSDSRSEYSERWLHVARAMIAVDDDRWPRPPQYIQSPVAVRLLWERHDEPKSLVHAFVNGKHTAEWWAGRIRSAMSVIADSSSADVADKTRVHLTVLTFMQNVVPDVSPEYKRGISLLHIPAKLVDKRRVSACLRDCFL